MRRLGGRFAVSLKIELKRQTSRELFKWFLAAVLFGAPISYAVAARAYHELLAAGASSARAILRIGRRGLVEILDRAGYVRCTPACAKQNAANSWDQSSKAPRVRHYASP